MFPNNVLGKLQSRKVIKTFSELVSHGNDVRNGNIVTDVFPDDYYPNLRIRLKGGCFVYTSEAQTSVCCHIIQMAADAWGLVGSAVLYEPKKVVNDPM